MTGPPLAVFPCSLRDKRPLVPHGFKSASSDPRDIARWEREYPDCLWGAPVPVGVFVVDVDPRHGGDGSLARLAHTQGQLPATRTTRTRSGGCHLWFACGVEVRQDQTGRLLGPGLDTRVAGRGYVIVPPSAGYVWLDERPIAAAPGWLVDRLRPEPVKVVRRPAPVGRGSGSRYVDAALRSECDTVRACPTGAGLRNATLHRAACRLGQLVGAGLLEDWRAAQELLAATSLPAGEARSTILSGLNWGAANPRTVAS